MSGFVRRGMVEHVSNIFDDCVILFSMKILNGGGPFLYYIGNIEKVLLSSYRADSWGRYIGYTQGIYRVYTRYIQGIYRVYTRYIQGIYRVFTGYIQGIYRVYIGYI